MQKFFGSSIDNKNKAFVEFSLWLLKTSKTDVLFTDLYTNFHRRLFVKNLLTVGCILRLWTNLVKHQYWANHLYGTWKWVTTFIIGDPEHQSKPKRNLWGKKPSNKEIEDYTFGFKVHIGIWKEYNLKIFKCL